MLSLHVQELSKAYNRKKIFTDLNFTHNQGIMGIAGPNGSGKSTLMKCLALLSRPNHGKITWHKDNAEMKKESIKHEIGYAAPYINLYDEMTVLENLCFILEAGGKEVNIAHVEEIINNLQLSSLDTQLYKTLSTGQRQRVKLASALIRVPSILFLDEPGSNLDQEGNDLVASILEREKEKNTLIFLATNDPKELTYCDQIITLEPS